MPTADSTSKSAGDEIIDQILAEDRYGDADARRAFIAELHVARDAMRATYDRRWAPVADLLNDEAERIVDIDYRVTADWIERNHRAALAVARQFIAAQPRPNPLRAPNLWIGVPGPRVDLDTFTEGRKPPYQPWEGDHTALVHVLWSARHDGLNLADHADEIASMIGYSRASAAREAMLTARALREAADEVEATSPDAAEALRRRAHETDGR